jgi:5-deoxy-glucuronate isomerase
MGRNSSWADLTGCTSRANSLIGISTESEVDLAEFSADVKDTHPTKLVPYAETSQDPGLKFTAGGTGCTRQVNLLIAKNVQAGRLLVGFTHSEPGNWTSWPPAEHTKMLEELYVYFDMRDGDAVLIPSGFHPNVAVPGHRIASCGPWLHIAKWKTGNLAL